jgi:DNA-binding response OmpR family regulator
MLASDGSTIDVLLVEDDRRLAEVTARYLEHRGILTTLVADGSRALIELGARRYDAVVLDLMLPGLDGVAVCRRIRATSSVPVLMLTARTSEIDRVLGLEAGADDYICKPFSSPELAARIRAAVRRDRGELGPAARTIRVGGLEVDESAMTATLDGRILPLTAHEHGLLAALARRAGQVLTREQLLELTRAEPDDVFDRAVDVHVSRMRQKLGDDPRRPRLLKTIRGRGYMLVRPSDRDPES